MNDQSDYDDDECIHGLGLASACTICNGRDRKREIEDHNDDWREFHAKYEGQCPGCNLPIQVGELVAWKADRPAIHARCRP